LSSVRLNDLLDAVAEGDQGALERLYQATAARLYGVVLRILRRPALAEEALADTYLRIWQKAGGYDPQLAPPEQWLIALARQAALQLARTREASPYEETPETRAGADEGEEKSEPDAISEELKELLACLAGLSEDQRRMLLIAYYDGWSREALGIEFDAPAATIKTWLLRSLEQLRERAQQ
jgi:RNA polymerase sigma-70 factor (ECF subfamily)